MSWDMMLDYIRMVSYTMVILGSLRGILKRNFNSILFIGDATMALGALLTLINFNWRGFGLSSSADLFITPAVVVWALIHFYDLFHYGNGK